MAYSSATSSSTTYAFDGNIADPFNLSVSSEPKLWVRLNSSVTVYSVLVVTNDVNNLVSSLKTATVTVGDSSDIL
jgi:hypothetical protein